jgi:hypothetical protein
MTQPVFNTLGIKLFTISVLFFFFLAIFSVHRMRPSFFRRLWNGLRDVGAWLWNCILGRETQPTPSGQPQPQPAAGATQHPPTATQSEQNPSTNTLATEQAQPRDGVDLSRLRNARTGSRPASLDIPAANSSVHYPHQLSPIGEARESSERIATATSLQSYVTTSSSNNSTEQAAIRRERVDGASV